MLIERLLDTMLATEASDLHLQSGATPHLRLAGELRAIDAPAPSHEMVTEFLERILAPKDRQNLQRRGSTDLAFTYGQSRLRVNVFAQQGTYALAVRRLSLHVPEFEALNLPPQLRDIANLPRGLVLVAGTTSSGKSTTIAAMIGHINRTQRVRVITIEDPVEYIHVSQQALVAQVEIGSDSPDYEQAVRQVLRQDPDVIMIGELRETLGIRVALRAADTGHLVFATVHAADARQTVERLIAMFDPTERGLLLTQLSLNIQAVICQRLARSTRAAGGGLLPVVEMLRGSPVVRKCILESRYDGLLQAMVNRDNHMQTFDQHLADLYRHKRISGATALETSTNPEALAMLLRGITTRDASRGLVR